MKPGQIFFGTEETVGGWFVAGTVLREALVGVGLPEAPPAAGSGPGFPWTLAGLLAAIALAGAAAAALALSRRRSGLAPAS
jgi:hypothetical protein